MSCNCNNNTPYNPCNACNQTPCIPPADCSCPVQITSDCLTYSGDDLACSGIVSGQTLTETLILLDAYICDAIDAINDSINLINVGAGLQIYAGIDGIGRRKIRTVITTGDLLTSVQNIDDITLSIDEDALNTFVEANQKTYTLDNIGTGAEIYKTPDDIVGDNTDFNLRTIIDTPQGTGTEIVNVVQLANEIEIQHATINSDTLTITTELDGSISIEVPQTSSIPAFIVNQDATTTYQEWLDAGGQGNPLFEYKGEGTAAKPFRDSIRYTSPITTVVTPNTSIQNALDAYVGSGTQLMPEFFGSRIEIQRSTTAYTFTGNVNYHGIVFSLQPNTHVISAPLFTTGEDSWFINLDHSDFSTTDVIVPVIELNQNSLLEIRNNGFKNKGTNLVTTNFAISKIIQIDNNGGVIRQSRTLEDLDVAGDYILFDLNSAATTGYKNDGNALISCKGGTITSAINPILLCGTHVSDFINVEFSFGRIGFDIDASIYPFEASTEAYIRMEKCNFYIFGNQALDSVFKLSGDNANFLIVEPLINGTVSNLAVIETHATTASLDPEFTMYNGVNKDGFSVINFLFKVNITSPRTDRWYKNYFNNNYISQGEIDLTTTDLTRLNIQGIVNFIGRSVDLGKNITEFLPRFTSRAAAVTNGMEVGTRFIKYTTVTSGSFVVGEEYKIVTTDGGSTDFTLIGAANNAIGTWFVATGVGAGGGTADKETIEIIS